MPFNAKHAKSANKIFRPWDAKDSAQDSTVSTTTAEDCEGVQIESSSKDAEPKEKDKCQEELRLEKDRTAKIETDRSVDLKSSPTQNYVIPSLHDFHTAPTDYPFYADTLHANLAQTLGLQPTDPLMIESMAHGYAFEEYARIMNEEHHAKLLNGRKQRPKKYKCPHCDVGFSNNGQLKGHIRIHTGERPFKCDEKNCGKTFTRNEELTRHKRIHSGLRPFPCAQCGKRFGRKDHLKKHTRTHLQPRGIYAVPVMLPMDQWATTTASSHGYTYLPMLY